MSGRPWFRALSIAILMLAASPVAGRAQFPPDSFTNLKVLPEDIGQRELVDLMASFTRALAVRCSHCHVGEEGRPLAEYDFPADDKLAKRKARAMLRMVERINSQHLADLEERADPPVKVECATCHRGTRKPRMIQDVLAMAYEAGGLDSTLTAYHSLRDEYYGRYTYDFSNIVLPDVAAEIAQGDDGSLADAAALLELNVELFPNSVFAQRQHASAALALAFGEEGIAAGRELYRRLSDRYAANAFPPFLLNQVGYRLLGREHVEAAIEAFKLNVERYPDNFNVYDSLGEAYMAHGDVDLAIRNYERSLELNPQNANAEEKLEILKKEK